MVVREITELMNNPKSYVKIFEKHSDYNLLVYEGSPKNVGTATSENQVTGFKVIGEGFLEIYSIVL